MEKFSKSKSNKCTIHKSHSNILFLSKSNKILQLHMSNSLPSCLKYSSEQFQSYKNLTKLNRKKIQKKKSNPTIGELLGDNDLFNYHYHKRYKSSKFKRNYSYYQSYSRTSHIHRKYQRLNSFNTNKQSSSHIIQSIPEINQIYFYPTTYNYTPLSPYCYYCYSKMTSYCSCFISDCYMRFSQQDTSITQYNNQKNEKFKYSDYYFHDKKN